MVDIGGGSTEVMWLDRTSGVGRSLSVPLGVVTLSEAFGADGGVGRYAEMVQTAREALGAALRRLGGLGGQLDSALMIGTSGTVTTLAAVHLGLQRYDRRRVDGLALPFAAVAEVGRRLRAMSNAERAAHPCIGRGRADLVVAGCAILDAIHATWPVARLRVADRGLREGILGELVGQSLDEARLAADRAA
jgi:exopolyphosphatase/guanosine-5'-triphosphate,3'-diphosphate pyrophosphatase